MKNVLDVDDKFNSRLGDVICCNNTSLNTKGSTPVGTAGTGGISAREGVCVCGKASRLIARGEGALLLL